MSMAGIWLRVALLFTRLGRIKWTLGENGNWLDQRANIPGARARAGAYGFLFLPLYARIPTEMYRASEQYQEEGRGRYSAAVPGADSGAARVRQTENRNHGRAAEAAPRSTACKISHHVLNAGKITRCQNVKTGRRR